MVRCDSELFPVVHSLLATVKVESCNCRVNMPLLDLETQTSSFRAELTGLSGKWSGGTPDYPIIGARGDAARGPSVRV
jgi:hypothetical protein